MIVWVVHGYLDVPSGLEEEYDIYGIFSSVDKAEEHKELMGDRYLYVDPFEVDNPPEVPR